ncbi:zinc-ribbon domain-containing protein [Streptomyces sp. NPDC047028]|uniref:zinc ribbon domain-containing protein n=1 Tax=Streptomyces sp. NPDC047028 TaxID=3155793 RepID=UPI0033FA62BA
MDRDHPPALPPQEAKTKAPVVTKTKPTRRLLPGDLICGNCGEGNEPTRRFCSRCGASLETATRVKEPWWRRLLPKPKTLKAGERPGQPGVKTGWLRRPDFRRLFRALRWFLGVVGLLAGLVFTLYSPARSWLAHEVGHAKQDAIREVDPQYTPIRPASAAATVSLQDHGPQNSVDGFNNTFWAAPSSSPDLALRYTFESPTTVSRLLVDSGNKQDFSGYDRPKKIHMVFSDGKSNDITLKDESSGQDITIKNAKKIDWMELHITSVYDSINGSGVVAITNVQFYTRK